jgi:hypothetical protein
MTGLDLKYIRRPTWSRLQLAFHPLPDGPAQLLELLEIPETLHRKDVLRVLPFAGLDLFYKPGQFFQIFTVLLVGGREDVLELPGHWAVGPFPYPA